MTFQKYICIRCYKLFSLAKVVTDCPFCKSSNCLQQRGQFEREQPWPRLKEIRNMEMGEHETMAEEK
jgi:hypothetical protein